MTASRIGLAPQQMHAQDGTDVLATAGSTFILIGQVGNVKLVTTSGAPEWHSQEAPLASVCELAFNNRTNYEIKRLR